MWKTIQDFTKYEVSDQGEIRNIKTKRILKPSKCANGYLQVHLRRDNKTHFKYVHRLVAEAFLEGEGEVNHLDGNSSNNSIHNLEWVTHKENIRHSYKQLNRTPPRGRVIIRVQYLNGEIKEFNGVKECADYYQVDPTTIRDYASHQLTPHRKIQAHFTYI